MTRLTIAPIGTCRIHTPLRRGQRRYPINVNLDRVYGFTHTSDEALQMVRYLQGEKTFQPETIPVIFRQDRDNGLVDAPPSRSDLTIVEISSAKKITSGDDSVQSNYLYHHLSDFFADPVRTQKFWSMVRRKARPDLAEFLAQDTAYRRLPQADRVLLRSLRLEPQNFQAIRADMEEICERIGRDKLLFVTHVNAATPDGEAIAQRERVIRWVKLAAEQLGAQCFDPSRAMVEFGQERAMENGGLDLTHYTPLFSDRVYADLHRQFIAPRGFDAFGALDQDEGETAAQFQADTIEALMEFDDLVAGSRKLFDALRSNPSSAPLVQLRGKLRASLGDFEQAIEDLEPFERAGDLTQETRPVLLDAYLGLKRWEDVRRIAEDLLGDEYKGVGLFTAAAKAEEALGNRKAALGYWKQAFREDRTQLDAALGALALLSDIGEQDDIDAWREEIISQTAQNATGWFELSRWAIERRDDELLAKLLDRSASFDPDKAEDLVGSMLSAGLHDAAATGLRKLSEDDADNKLPQATIDRWAVEFRRVAVQRANNGDFEGSYLLADAASAVSGDRGAQKAKISAVRHYRDEIREAFLSGDLEKVVRIGDEAREIVLQSPDAALRYVIALAKTERTNEAIEAGLAGLAVDPNNAGLLRWVGRMAYEQLRFSEARHQYLRLAQMPEGKDKFEREVSHFFETSEERAFRQIRVASAMGQFDRAIEIVEYLREHGEQQERVQAEAQRVARQVAHLLREVESQDEEADGETQALLQLMLRATPDDKRVLRRAALEAMRDHRFEEAARHWGHLTQLDPMQESNARNLERCRILATRQQKVAARRSKALA